MIKQKRMLYLLAFLFLLVGLTACGGSSKKGTIVGVRAMSNYSYANNLQNLDDVTLTGGLLVRLRDGSTVLAECSRYEMLDVEVPYFFDDYTVMDQTTLITIKVPYEQKVTIENKDEFVWQVVEIEPVD